MTLPEHGSISAPAVSSPPLLQRLGTAYLRRRAATLPAVEGEDEIHILDPQEQRDLLAIERAMIMRAVVAGALSGLAAALAEVLAAPWQNTTLGWHANMGYWSLVVGVTTVATLLEITFLYWDALRSVHDLARAAGVRLFGGADRSRVSPLATALARAALEMPTPVDNEFRVDPYREVSKWTMLLASVAYKAKITVTSFLLKALLRRALGRAALRVWLAFVGVPVCAAWNAVVAYLVVRQARLRAMGPSAARMYLHAVLDMSQDTAVGAQVSATTAAALWAAVGCCVVRTHQLHANHLALMRQLRQRVPRPEHVDINDSGAFIGMLARLDDTQRTQALAVVVIAAVLDGRVTRDERRLLAEAFVAAGRRVDFSAVRALRRRFVRGRSVNVAMLQACAGAA